MESPKNNSNPVVSFYTQLTNQKINQSNIMNNNIQQALLDGYVLKKKERLVGKKSKGFFKKYSKKFMTFLYNGKILAYFGQNHLPNSIVEGFQFVDNFTEILDAPKGDTKKLNLIIQDLECTLQFDSPSIKQKWLNQINQAKKLPQSQSLKMLIQEANKNFQENSDFWFTQKLL